MNADKFIRTATAGVVLTVAAFAAVVSYSHIYDLGKAHGQSGTAARLLPLSVDGLILAASLVLLHEARNRRDSPPLAWFLLAMGVGATVAANVAYGLSYGPVGALVSAWPAVGFIGSVELLMLLVRRSRILAVPVTSDVTAMSNGLPGYVHQAQDFYADQIAGGEVPTIRKIRSDLGVGSHRAQQVRAHIEALATSPSG